MQRSVYFRLPLEGLPRALVSTDYALSRAELSIDGAALVAASTAEALRAGVTVLHEGRTLELRASKEGEVQLTIDGAAALREDRLRAPPSRSAWVHAFIALGGSVLGFVASYLYVLRAGASGDAWAMKMAVHMAGWHLLLVLTLFPSSVWGQRLGIVAVQCVSALFFCIHLGIAIANAAEAGLSDGPLVAALNALSGAGFLAAVLYGQKARADMDPLVALARAYGHAPCSEGVA